MLYPELPSQLLYSFGVQRLQGNDANINIVKLKVSCIIHAILALGRWDSISTTLNQKDFLLINNLLAEGYIPDMRKRLHFLLIQHSIIIFSLVARGMIKCVLQCFKFRPAVIWQL